MFLSLCDSPEPSQRDTLIRYLLDELHAYEVDYSDALAPVQQEIDRSLAGEAALVQPKSTEELRMVHSSVVGDIQELRADMNSIAQSVRAMMEVVGRLENSSPGEHAAYAAILLIDSDDH